MRSEQPVRTGSPLPEVRRLAGFEVIAELGRGARSTVYRVRRVAASDALAGAQARRSGDDAPAEYALKILDFSLSDTSAALIAFRREAALLAGVNHPGLTRVHDIGTTSGRPYLVMDLVDGRSLAEKLTAGAMPSEQVIALALDIVDPLAAVHRRGLVHRDLKPPNIMVLADGQARLIDFGLTARKGEGDGETLVAVGTFAYCAPEQSGVLKRPVDHRSDLYSLGVVLFECLAGVLPFPTTDVGELLRMHAVTPAPDLRELVPGIPRGLADVVATLLAKDPDDRYQNGEELAADLRALAGSGAVLPGIGWADQRSVGTPLRGRDHELAELERRWDEARHGRGGVCVIRGPSGAGKSRLAAELAAHAQAAGRIVLRGKSSPDDPVPFGPLRTAVDDHLQALDRMPLPDRELGHARIRAACAGVAASMLSGLTPALTTILREPGGSVGVVEHDQFAFAVASLLTGLSHESGDLMLLLDDVQWLDPGSRRVLELLSFDLDTAALLVVATARDDERSVAAANAFVAEMGAAVDVDLVLAPLDETGVADQIESLMPGLSSNTRVVSLLNNRSNGSPFVVQEYLRAVVDAGLLRPSWGTWILDEDGLDALELPNDALGLVITRVQSLGPEVRDLLIVAAAIGARFRPESVAAVRSGDLVVVLAGLVEAAGHGLVESREGGQFAFLHDRIREALLDELDASATAQLHEKIAEALNAMPIPDGGPGTEHVYAVAHHYLLTDHQPGGRTGFEDRAFTACLAAGRLALDNHAPAEAVAFLEHARDLRNPRDSEFLLLLGTALKQADQLLAAGECLEQALDAETEPLSRAEILIQIADVHRSFWDTDAAEEAVNRGLAELGARLPRNPLLLTASTVLMFLAALLLQATRIRFGPLTGMRRRRCVALAGLHQTGMYASAINMKLSSMLVHSLRGLYRANQLGTGWQFAWGQSAFGTFCGMVGLRRSSDRAYARAAADPVNDNPALRAVLACSRGLGLFLSGQDNGQELSLIMDTQGPGQDFGNYMDMVSILITEACLQGRTAEAEYWLVRGQRRLGARSGGLRAFVGNTAVTQAICGRTAQAGSELPRIAELFAGHNPPRLMLPALQATVMILAEQGDFGTRFDDAVAKFDAMKVGDGHFNRARRGIHYPIALGRLAQLRSASSAQRPARLIAARQAVRVVTKAPKIDVYQTRAILVRADLLVLENEPRRALRVLGRMPPFLAPDAPRLYFEAARIRARALIALDGTEEAARQAGLASSIAQTNGWPHLVRAVTAEFGVTPHEQGSTDHSGIYTTSPSGGVERQRLQALQQVSAAASRVLDPGVLARIALDETIRILAADRAFLFLTDGPDRELVPYLGRDAAGIDVPELTGYSASLIERVRETRSPLVVTGTEEGAALGAQSVVLHGLRSIMVAPLELDGRLLGVVYLDSQVAKGIFTAEDVGILTALTNHIATSLETTRAAQLEISVQTAHRQRDLADMLRQTLTTMAETLDPAEVTSRMLQAAARVTRCDGVWVLSVDGDACTLIANDGPDDTMVRRAIADEPKLRALITRKRPSIGTSEAIPLALADPLAAAFSWIALPLQTHNRKVGALVLAASTPDVDLGEQIEVAAVVAAQGMAAYDKAILFAQVQELAVVDELTGIANRRRFFEVAARDLAAAVRQGQELTAMMADIDHFKLVNDTYGHAIGDDVIRVVAQRLNGQLRATDLLGRYGGEEFALLTPGAGLGDSLPERLRACIADTPIETRSGPLVVTISIGLAYLTADEDIAALLARADQALYRAKKAGRNCVRSA